MPSVDASQSTLSYRPDRRRYAMPRRPPIDPSLIIEADRIAAREYFLDLWSDKYESIQSAGPFEIGIMDEAHELAEFTASSDTRTHGILVVSFLEDALRKNFAEAWGIEGKADFEKHFGSNGPIATFSQRTLIAKSLGWLSPAEAGELDVMRKIRNALAHNHRVHSLSERALLGLSSSLVKREETWCSTSPGYAEAFGAAPTETKLRMRLFCAGMFIISGALSRSKRLALSIPLDFRPSKAWDGMLEIERGLVDAAIRSCWRALGLGYAGRVYQSPTGPALTEHK